MDKNKKEPWFESMFKLVGAVTVAFTLVFGTIYSGAKTVTFISDLNKSAQIIKEGRFNNVPAVDLTIIPNSQTDASVTKKWPAPSWGMNDNMFFNTTQPSYIIDCGQPQTVIIPDPPNDR